jgi:hypothetical protein
MTLAVEASLRQKYEIRKIGPSIRPLGISTVPALKPLFNDCKGLISTHQRFYRAIFTFNSTSQLLKALT